MLRPPSLRSCRVQTQSFRIAMPITGTKMCCHFREVSQFSPQGKFPVECCDLHLELIRASAQPTHELRPVLLLCPPSADGQRPVEWHQLLQEPRRCDARHVQAGGRRADLGSEGATLKCKGSYLYALRRYGVNTLEVVLRRMKHTPKLPIAIVFSEATENVQYGYGIHWEPGAKRVLKSPQGTVLELLVSKSNLGWLKVKPITDISEVCALITADQANNMCMRLDCHQKMQAQLLAERHDALKLAIAQKLLLYCCFRVFVFSILYFIFVAIL